MPLTDKKEDDMARVFEPTLALTLAVAASAPLVTAHQSNEMTADEVANALGR
jgi:hypothetical protein